MQLILDNIKSIQHGFKHIVEAGDILLANKQEQHLQVALKLLEDLAYQVRMLATYILGQLSPSEGEAMNVLKTKVAMDGDWRMQEMLAKAFDHYCKVRGYEQCLDTIRDWLSDNNPKVARAVVEGLRIWTSRPYFKTNPEEAISLIGRHKGSDSEYLRKSVGNALRDIAKKHEDIILQEVSAWDLSDERIMYTYKLVCKRWFVRWGQQARS